MPLPVNRRELIQGTVLSGSSGLFSKIAACGEPTAECPEPISIGVDIQEYGCIQMFDAAAAESNTAVLLAALNSESHILIPSGDFHITGNVSLEGKIVEGAGASTAICGDGDVFVDAVNAGLRNLVIRNRSVLGKLVSVSAGDIARSQFSNVGFQTSSHHIYADATCVDWVFENCTFLGATVCSRYFKSCWACKEISCYTWYNAEGLRFGGSNVSTFTVQNSVFEYNAGSAVILDAGTSAEIHTVIFVGTHFEGNGSNVDTGKPAVCDVAFVATGRIRNVLFQSCAFWRDGRSGATPAPTVSSYDLRGGNIVGVRFANCSTYKQLAPTHEFVSIDSVDALLDGAVGQVYGTPTYAPAIFSRSAGVCRVVGVQDGNLATQALLKPPPEATLARVYVRGNYYNQTAGTNTAYLEAYCDLGGAGRVFVVTDRNHSAGSNQGFLVSWMSTTGQLKVTNKNAMSAMQSGDTLIEFFV